MLILLESHCYHVYVQSDNCGKSNNLQTTKNNPFILFLPVAQPLPHLNHNDIAYTPLYIATDHTISFKSKMTC